MSKISNYSVLKSLILEEIVDDISTKKASQMLGYNFDQFYRWMNNLKVLKWDEFVKICETFNLPLGESCNVFAMNQSIIFESHTILNYFRDTNSFKSNQELADYLNCHISVLKRFMSGATVPNTEIIFKILDYHSERLPIFLKALLKGNIKNPILKSYIEPTYQSALASTRYPQTAIIEALVNLEEYLRREPYLTSENYLAEKLKISPIEVKQILEIMLQNNKIEFNHDHITTLVRTTNFSGVPFDDAINFYFFLLNEFKKLFESRIKGLPTFDKTPGMVVGRIIPMSVTTMNKVNEIISRTHDEIISVCESDNDPKTECRALLLLTSTIIK